MTIADPHLHTVTRCFWMQAPSVFQRVVATVVLARECADCKSACIFAKRINAHPSKLIRPRQRLHAAATALVAAAMRSALVMTNAPTAALDVVATNGLTDDTLRAVQIEPSAALFDTLGAVCVERGDAELARKSVTWVQGDGVWCMPLESTL